MTHPVITDVTNRIAMGSAEQRDRYLERTAAAAENGPARGRLACANLAHGFAASDTRDKSANEVPEILVGAGTVVGTTQPKQALAAGAQFLVSPGSTPDLRAAMRDTGLPHLPGVATVSEVMALLEDSYTDMKFFPAEAAGGAAYLRAIHSPVPSARFCPTGGITPTNIAEYLKTPNVGCVGGSWLTPADAVERGDWGRISSLAAVALETRQPYDARV